MYYEHHTAFTRLAWVLEDQDGFTTQDIELGHWDSIEQSMDREMLAIRENGYGDSVVNIIYQLHSKLGISISKLQYYDYVPRDMDGNQSVFTITEEEKATIAIFEDIYNNGNSKADIITMSLGFYSLTLPGWAILDQLIQAGVVIIASAGNSDTVIN